MTKSKRIPVYILGEPSEKVKTILKFVWVCLASFWVGGFSVILMLCTVGLQPEPVIRAWLTALALGLILFAVTPKPWPDTWGEVVNYGKEQNPQKGED